MLYHLIDQYREYGGIYNVFRYITFRSLIAFVITFLLVVTFQPYFIKWFRKRNSNGQPIRDDGPQSHFSKKGTPTMGGLVIILSVFITTFLLSPLDNIYIIVVLGVLLSYSFLGFCDDYKKVKEKKSGGVSARMKLFWQFLVAIFATLTLIKFAPGFNTTVSVPFFKDLIFDLGIFYIPFAACVIVGASNAVNLTDGLDGLVTGPVMTTAFAYGVFAYVSGHSEIANYLHIQNISGSGELAVFSASIIAAGMGFLWFNTFPAQVFMGDVGSLALGGAIGVISVITKQELLLPLVGGIFVVEALSVIIQVAYFKSTGKRVFRMAPIHHHFELKGMPEPKIIVRFWIVSILLAIVAIATLKLR